MPTFEDTEVSEEHKDAAPESTSVDLRLEFLFFLLQPCMFVFLSVPLAQLLLLFPPSSKTNTKIK